VSFSEYEVISGEDDVEVPMKYEGTVVGNTITGNHTYHLIVTYKETTSMKILIVSVPSNLTELQLLLQKVISKKFLENNLLFNRIRCSQRQN
jgi:hypothetical protein